MKKVKRLKHKMRKKNSLIKKAAGICVAIAGAVIVIHTIPIVAWYIILFVLFAAMVVYLFI